MTQNYYTTLVSCRIDNDVLKKLQKFLEGRPYLKRSSVINQTLRRVFLDNDYLNLYDFLYGKKPLKH